MVDKLNYEGFMIQGKPVNAYARTLGGLKTVIGKYSHCFMEPTGEISMHRFTESTGFATVNIKAPVNPRLTGVDLVDSVIKRATFATVRLDVQNIRKLDKIASKITRMVCYPDGLLVFDDGKYNNHVDFQGASLRNVIFTEVLMETSYEATQYVKPLGPFNFTPAEAILESTKDLMRVCMNAQGCWIETPGDETVKSVRFDLLHKQLVPMKNVESSSISAYIIDKENDMWCIEITRRNRWFCATQRLNVYHYYRKG